jgi:hypothetical protein
VALLQKECTRRDKGTLAGVGVSVVEELLLIRQTGEREDLKKQLDNWRGRDVELTFHQSAGGLRRLHP